MWALLMNVPIKLESGAARSRAECCAALSWGCRSQRLCRHLLNVLATTATALDIHEVRGCSLVRAMGCCMHACPPMRC